MEGGGESETEARGEGRVRRGMERLKAGVESGSHSATVTCSFSSFLSFLVFPLLIDY